ncbi:MAG TPA: hypothetical protein VHB21_01465 [Minicystis sp.]|nr:hypothetical protein [Minicystis sp.]
MDTLVQWTGRLVDLLLSPFDHGPEWIGLAIFSLLSGVVILWAFGKLTNKARLQAARDEMASAIYEIRIFGDSPLRIFSAQGRLLRGSFVYTLFTIPAFLVIAVPLALVYVRMEARHGLAPLDGRAPFVVHAVLAPGVDAHQVSVVEQGSIKTTAPPVFVGPTRELYFRLAAPADAKTVVLRAGDKTVEKSLDVGGTGRTVSEERASGAAALVAVSQEPPIPSAAGIESISIRHAPRSVRIVFGAPWWVHWFILSTVSALALRKRLGVVI